MGCMSIRGGGGLETRIKSLYGVVGSILVLGSVDRCRCSRFFRAWPPHERHFRPVLLPANHLQQLTEELFEALVHI